MNLQERAKAFLTEFGIPVSVFCRKMNLSRTSYYDWLSGNLRLSAETLNRIDEYLSRYEF